MCSATRSASLSQVGVSWRQAALLCEPAWSLGMTARAGWLLRATLQPSPFTDQNTSRASRDIGGGSGHQDIGDISTGMRAEGWNAGHHINTTSNRASMCICPVLLVVCMSC